MKINKMGRDERKKKYRRDSRRREGVGIGIRNARKRGDVDE